jgi:guanyl-specific ribonuclease Sa
MNNRKLFYYGGMVLVCAWLVISNLHQGSMAEANPSAAPVTQNLGSSNSPKVINNPLNLPTKAFSDLPDYAQHTVNFLKQNNFTSPESGYVGGRIFTNYEKVLPVEGSSYYHEWDVHPKVAGVNRGTERIVSGEKGEVYFTNTHYGEAGSPAFYVIVF